MATKSFSYWQIVSSYLHARTNSLPDDYRIDLAQSELFGKFLRTDPPASPFSSCPAVPMSGDVSAVDLMENIVRHFVQQNLKLTVSVWKRMGNFFEKIVEQYDKQLVARKSMEILFILSKLNAEECLAMFKKYSSAVEAYEAEILDKTMARLEELLDTIISSDPNPLDMIREIDEQYASVIRIFLKRPAIKKAIQDTLSLVEITVDEQWIESAIDEMKLYFTEGLQSFNGITMRDGILLVCDRSTLEELVSTEKRSKKLARLLTTSVHETVHFMSRRFHNSYNFESPIKDFETRRYEDDDREKGFLESGRAVELKLFGGIQPAWLSSLNEAAGDFIRNAESYQTYPLISKNSGKKRLVEREHRSVACACDIEFITEPFIC